MVNKISVTKSHNGQKYIRPSKEEVQRVNEAMMKACLAKKRGEKVSDYPEWFHFCKIQLPLPEDTTEPTQETFIMTERMHERTLQHRETMSKTRWQTSDQIFDKFLNAAVKIVGYIFEYKKEAKKYDTMRDLHSRDQENSKK